MNDQVGIAPNRRSKMGIASRGQTEVTDILRLVVRLLHGTQQNMVDHFFFRFTATGLQKLLNFQRRNSFSLQQQTVAETQEERSNGFERLCIGPLMHSVEQREILFF